MKTSSPLSLALVALLATGWAADCQAYTWGGKLDLAVVAEQMDPAASPAPPTADKPAYYVAYDAGYIEEGDPIGGINPPPAAAIAQALHEVLTSQHYLPATAGSPPSLLLVYHWGLLNRDSHQIRSFIKLQPNLTARINLVATRKYAARIEQDLLDRRQPVAVRIPIIDPTERDLIQLAADDRQFVIVSAYDYSSVARHEARLLWRVKLSTRSAGSAMVDALPTLLRASAPYLGRNVPDTVYANEPLVRAGQVQVGTPKVEEFLPPPEVARQVDQKYLDGLMGRERVKFSGERYADPDAAVDPAPGGSADLEGNSSLPPALAARIQSYEHEKSALQDALAARIKERTPGADTRQAIDAFNRDHADRIAALTSERRAIRDELVTLAAANPDSAAGKSLQALQQEFAAGVQQLAAEATPAQP